MSRRFFYNLLVVLPIVLAMSFGFSLWQTDGQFLQSWGDLKFGNLLTVSQAQAQVDTCVEYPDKSALGEGRLYYDSCRNAFMMSKNNGDWEEMGGGLWKSFLAPMNPNDIYNTNSGVVYTRHNAIFGVNDWGPTTEQSDDNVLVLQEIQDNLIYGAVNIDSAVDPSGNSSSALLRLESFNPTSVDANKYSNLFTVQSTGRVVVGQSTSGRLVTPELCLPNDDLANIATNCISSWADLSIEGGAISGDSEKWWFRDPSSTPGSDDLIFNRNEASPGAGGSVKITRDLTTYGSIELNQNTGSDIKKWTALGLKPNYIGEAIEGLWFDKSNSMTTLVWPEDPDTVSTTFSEKSTGAIYVAVSKKKIFVARSKASDSDIPLYNSLNTLTNSEEVKTIFGVSPMGLKNVCTVGTEGNYKEFRIIAVGTEGEIWSYAYNTTNGKFQWTRAQASNNGLYPDWYGIACKNNSSASDTYEAYVVGEYGAIARLSGAGPVIEWLKPPVVSAPKLNAIWLNAVYYNYDATDGTKYFAVGDGGSMYYWPQDTLASEAATKLKSVNSGTNKNLYAVSGPSGATGTDKYLYVGGDAGVLCRASIGTTMAFTCLTPGVSTKFDISGIVAANKTIFVSLKSKVTGQNNESFFIKHTYDHLITPTQNQNVEDWTDAPMFNNDEYEGVEINALSGMTKTKFADGIYKEEKLNIYGAGGEGGIMFDTKFLKYVNYAQLGEPIDWSLDIDNTTVTREWREGSKGGTATYYSAWQPYGMDSLDNNNSFVGGAEGVILQGLVNTKTINVASGQNSITWRGIWGYKNNTNTYSVYAVGHQPDTSNENNSLNGYLFYYNITTDRFEPIRMDSGNYGLNGIWGKNDGSLIIAVGNNGLVRYCTSNCTALAGWSNTISLISGSGVNLRGISGKVIGVNAVYFIVGSNGNIWSCTNTTCGSPYSSGNSLRAVWFNPLINEAWAVGDAGKIYKNTNPSSTNNWTLQTPSVDYSARNFYSVGGMKDLVFLGSDLGKIIKYDTTSSPAVWVLDEVASSLTNINAISGVDIIKNAVITGGSSWAVGSNGIGVKYITGGKAMSGDLIANFNKWGVSADSGTNVTFPGSFTETPATGETHGINACPPGEFMVGFDVDIDGLIRKLYCRKL